MATIELVTGDPLIKTINLLKKNDTSESAFNIPTSGVDVTCAIVSKDHARRLTDEVAVSSAESGADWTTSILVINIPKTQTDAIEEFGAAFLEIQVNDGAEITWFHPVNIINGLIA